VITEGPRPSPDAVILASGLAAESGVASGDDRLGPLGQLQN